METPTTHIAPVEEPGFSLDLTRLYHILREKLLVIIACVFVMLALAGLYLLRAPKLYEANMTVQVDQIARQVTFIEDIAPEEMATLEMLKTIESNLASPDLMLRIIHTLKLGPGDIGLPPRAQPYSDNQLAVQLSNRVDVNLHRATRLMDIGVLNEKPELAKKMCETLVKEYLGRNYELHAEIARSANKFLVEEAARLKKNLDQSQQALQEFRALHQSLSLVGDPANITDNITVEKLKALSANVTEAKSARLKLEADAAQMAKLAGHPPEELLSITSVAQAETVIEAKKLLTERESEFANLKQRYLPRHPKYIQAEGQVKQLRAEYQKTIAKASEGVGNALQSAMETEKKFEEALKEQEGKALELNQVIIPYGVLSSEMQTNQSLYDSVVKRLKETDVTKAIQEENIRIIDPPLVGDKPAKPRTLLVLAGALAFGFISGLVAAFGLYLLDSSLKTVDQAESALGLTALTVIPRGRGLTAAKTLITVLDPAGSISESIRTLRTSIGLRQPVNQPAVCLFTSALEGEGKSFCAANYAVSLAQAGLKTLLIDADLRKPSLAGTFFEDAPGAGVTEVISGKVTADQAVQRTKVENLVVMTAGRQPARPAELLLGDGFAKLIKEVAQHVDRVVIDSAPILAVSDTLLIARHVTSIILVVEARKTPAKVVRRAIKKLSEAGGKVIGQVLNRLPESRGAGYYYHYSTGKYGKEVYEAPVARTKAKA